jgi:AraC-like DNA-binding protein
METVTKLPITASNTDAAHRQAVERVILEMREHLAEPLSLPEMAKIACLSPFHFDRVFHQTTGIPPVQFLYALRIEAAKRLLLTSSFSITDICYEVGYNSIGTFTSRFTQLVGLSPRQFRYLAETVKTSGLETLLVQASGMFKKSTVGPSVVGRLIISEHTQRLVFVGLFPTLIPQSRPIAGTLLTSAGPYRISSVPDGHYYAFAAAFPLVKDLMAYLLPDTASLLVGVGERPISVRSGQCGDSVNVTLRPVQITDPPILIALPSLLT